jgi:hypothetical protein
METVWIVSLGGVVEQPEPWNVPSFNDEMDAVIGRPWPSRMPY